MRGPCRDKISQKPSQKGKTSQRTLAQTPALAASRRPGDEMETAKQKIEMIPVADIIPYEGNPRIIDAAIDDVVTSIRTYGFRGALLLDRNKVIITGHTRLAAAKRLGIPALPCTPFPLLLTCVAMVPRRCAAATKRGPPSAREADWSRRPPGGTDFVPSAMRTRPRQSAALPTRGQPIAVRRSLGGTGFVPFVMRNPTCVLRHCKKNLDVRQTPQYQCNCFCLSASAKKTGRPGGIRTRDPQIRNLMLCPAELLA